MDQKANIIKEENISSLHFTGVSKTFPQDTTNTNTYIQRKEKTFSTDKEVISNIDSNLMDTVYLLAATLWLEARGEGIDGMHAVLNVILNRSGGNINKAREAVLKPKQFSCWNSVRDPISFSREMAKKASNGTLRDSKSYYDALKLVDKALKGKLEDITGNALFYFNPKIANPSWAKKLKKTKTIGNHEFYTIIKEYLKQKVDMNTQMSKNENSKKNKKISEDLIEPIILGAIDEWGDVHSITVRDSSIQHPLKWKHYKTWRYIPSSKILMWWEMPDEREKEIVESWLKDKGYSIKFRQYMGKKIDFWKENYEYPLPKSDNEWHSYTGMNNWKGKIIYMSPDEFLSLVKKMPADYFNKNSYEKIKNRIVNNLPLDPPVLEVDFENKTIIAHEGRHRAMAAKELNIKKIPVFVYTGNLYKRVPQWDKSEHDIIDNLSKYFSPEGSNSNNTSKNKLFEYIQDNMERFRAPLMRYIKRVFAREYNENQMLMFGLTMDEFINKIIDKILDVKIYVNYTNQKNVPATGCYRIDKNEIEIDDVNLDKYESSSEYSAYVDSVIFHELVHAVNFYKKLYDKVSYSALELGDKYYSDPEEVRAYTAEIHDFLKKIGFKKSQIRKMMSKYTSDTSKQREDFIDFILKQKIDEFYKLIL